MPEKRTLSPAELAQLEHAFAIDPGSEAYKPLAEAYLGMGRFMEAMVVCKKGVKAHPAVADPRVLLARVYAEQGKDKKALEELQGALQVQPSDKGALRLLAALQFKGGEAAAKDTLLKAFEADPQDAQTLELMEKNGVAVPRPAAPEPPPQPVEPPPSVVVAPSATAASGVQRPVARTPAVGNGAVAPRVSAPRAAASTGQQVRPQPVRRAIVEDDDDDDVETSDVKPRPRKKSSGASKAIFFLLIFAVPASAAAYYVVGQIRANHIREANNLIREADKLVKADTFTGYAKAIDAAQKALELDGDASTNLNARGLLAYAYTVRWGEHVHDDENHDNAEKNIKTGLAKNEASAYLHAAEALFDFYSGKTDEGLKAIDARIATAESNKKQVSIYYLTRGVLLMNSGDLEASREALEKAQAIMPDDPRVYLAIANLNRRRGLDAQALIAYAAASRYSSKGPYPDGLTGEALLLLDQPEPAQLYCKAAANIELVQNKAESPSPRQLALNNFARALLASRVSRDIPQYNDKAFQKQLTDCTHIEPDEAKARKIVADAEAEGLQQDKNNPELLVIRGRRLAWEGKIDEAAAEIKKAIDMNPVASQFHVELARILMRKEGGEAQAEEALNRALKLVPSSPKLLSMLGEVQFRQKKFDDARKTFEKAVSDASAKNPEAHYYLGRLYRDTVKDLPRAIAQLQKAGEEYYANAAMASQSFDELGQTFEANNQRDQANAAYEKALNAARENPAPYCHLARLLSKDPKEKDKAHNLAAEFLKLAPKTDPCADDMQRL